MLDGVEGIRGKSQSLRPILNLNAAVVTYFKLTPAAKLRCFYG